MNKEEALNILNNVVRLSLKSGVFEESADVTVIHQALITFANDVANDKAAEEAKTNEDSAGFHVSPETVTSVDITPNK